MDGAGRGWGRVVVVVCTHVEICVGIGGVGGGVCSFCCKYRIVWS
jgi:hypothetical protein